MSRALMSRRYFDQFVSDDFQPDPAASVQSEIDRIGDLRNWGDKLRKKHFRNAGGGEWIEQQDIPDSMSALNNPFARLQLDPTPPRYFDQFRSKKFEQDDTADIWSEIVRLGKLFQWDKQVRKERFREACCQEWAYFTRGKDLHAFQGLCRDLCVEEGRSITKCKKALKQVHVSIVDYLNCKRASRAVQPTFNHVNALRTYMARHAWTKIYPLKMAKKDRILKEMLEHIF